MNCDNTHELDGAYTGEAVHVKNFTAKRLGILIKQLGATTNLKTKLLHSNTDVNKPFWRLRDSPDITARTEIAKNAWGGVL